MMKKHVSPAQTQILFPDMGYTFADFFCGCGGLSLGFINAGLKCVAAMDIALDALHTYWYNLCYSGWSHLWIDPKNEKDIKTIQKKWRGGETQNHLFKNGIPDNWLSVEEPMPCLNLFAYSIMNLSPEEFMEICKVRPGDIKIFCGGPPCQGFSTANTSRSVYDERNQLPLRFIHYCKVCKPEIVFMENVPGIVSLGRKKGEKEGPFIKWIRNAFNEAGYDMEWQIHNAANYGVPQNRKRVIFIAVRKGEQFPSHPEKTPEEESVWVREAIGDLPPVNSGECYNGEPYKINTEKGFVICPYCFKLNREIKKKCWSCDENLSNPIRGSVVKAPKIGITLINMK